MHQRQYRKICRTPELHPAYLLPSTPYRSQPERTEGGLTGANTQRNGKPGKRHGAEHYCNNRRTPRTEEQADTIPTGGGRHGWALSGRTTAATACAGGRHVQNTTDLLSLALPDPQPVNQEQPRFAITFQSGQLSRKKYLLSVITRYRSAQEHHRYHLADIGNMLRLHSLFTCQPQHLP